MAEAGKPADDLRGDALLHGGGTAVFAGAARRQTPDAAIEGSKAIEAIESGGSKAVKAVESGGVKAVKVIEAPDGIRTKIPERAAEKVTIRGGILWSFVFLRAGVL